MLAKTTNQFTTQETVDLAQWLIAKTRSTPTTCTARGPRAQRAPSGCQHGIARTPYGAHRGLRESVRRRDGLCGDQTAHTNTIPRQRPDMVCASCCRHVPVRMDRPSGSGRDDLRPYAPLRRRVHAAGGDNATRQNFDPQPYLARYMHR